MSEEQFQYQSVKLAVFKHVKYNWYHIFNEEHEGSTDYIRVTEYKEVTFKPLPKDVQINAEVKALDTKIEEFKKEALQTLSNLEARKSELLAITFQESADDN